MKKQTNRCNEEKEEEDGYNLFMKSQYILRESGAKPIQNENQTNRKPNYSQCVNHELK